MWRWQKRFRPCVQRNISNSVRGAPIAQKRCEFWTRREKGTRRWKEMSFPRAGTPGLSRSTRGENLSEATNGDEKAKAYQLRRCLVEQRAVDGRWSHLFLRVLRGLVS